MSGPRRHGREAALRILYLWEVGRIEPAAAIETYFSVHASDASDTVRSFAATLVEGTVGDLASLDAMIEQHSARWRIGRLAIIDRLILRLAIWELRHATDVPPAAVLNEAVELARRFSTEEAVKFVNGVLDAVRKTLQDGAPAV